MSRTFAKGNSRRRDRGVALLMTLGIMSLLLILAMSFSFTARTESMAASVGTDLVRARLLAEGGLERALGFLKKQFSGDLYPGSDFYGCSDPVNETGWDASTESGWTDRGGRYVASIAPTGVDSSTNDPIAEALASTLISGLTSPLFTPESTLHSSVGWIPITVTHAAGEESCIGLVSYVIIDESGKLDPGALVSDSENENSNSAAATVARTGWYETEICLADAGVPGHNMFRETGLATDPGFMPVGGRWHSLTHIVSELERYLGTTPTQAQANACTKALFPSTYDIEAFDDSGTARHRFCVRPSTWSWDDAALFDTDAEVSGLGNAADAYTGPGLPTAFADGAAGSGIPHLAGLQATVDLDGDAAVDAADHALVVRQTCANIIDFCDSDSAATTDAGHTYVGLEAVPYINEIALSFSYTWADMANPAPDTSDDIWTLTVTADVEVVNIYPASVTAADIAANGLTLVIDYDLNGQSAGETVQLCPAATTVAANTYQVFSATWTETEVSLPLATLSNLAEVLINDLTVSLDSADGLADYAKIETSVGNVGSGLVSGTIQYVNTQVADPRVNTQDCMWTWDTTPFGATKDFTFPPTTVDYRNSIGGVSANPSALGAGFDVETVTDPGSGLSTAFIRNAPMQSLWELGCIHRGEPFRTINLQAYDATPAATLYTEGDAALLSQVKLREETETRGKFNVNSLNKPAWQAVMAGITVGSSYADFTGGTAITCPVPSAVLTGIFNANGVVAGSPFSQRCLLADVAALKDGVSAGVAQATDAAKEEIIGKLANLLTVRPNYFTVLVCAQAVKDTGTVASDVRWQQTPNKYCKIMAEQKLLATIYRDAITNEFSIRRVDYLDE